MRVKLKEDINLKDLKEDHWNGCQYDTMRFLTKHYSYTDEFEVSEIGIGCYEIDGFRVNKKCFEIIEEDKKIEKLENEKCFYDYATYDNFKDKIDKTLYLIRAINLLETKMDITNDKINEIIDYLEEEDKNE